MRINLSVNEGEYADLLKAIEYQKSVLPGSEPTITGMAKTCMNSGLQVLLEKANNAEQVESQKAMKRPKK